MRFYTNPRLSTAKPFPNLEILEIAYLFKVNPKTVRKEWDEADIYEMLALHAAKQMAVIQTAKDKKASVADVLVPSFCPLKASYGD